ncbi:MAG: M15 family metallopeptidase [Clostridiales bacterium]|jgi:hypothetical protein|nr:M15 family metallopeptidase [Clostridiales bacterium]
MRKFVIGFVIAFALTLAGCAVAEPPINIDAPIAPPPQIPTTTPLVAPPTTPPAPPQTPEPDPEPIFTMEALPEHIIEKITGSSFHDSTPFPHAHLTYLTITYMDFYGESRLGNMIVAAEIGEEVLEIFREIYESGFPIAGMRLIDYYDASDYLSMAANNSVAFNFRYIAGTTTLSRHAFGMAIDINPIQNPFIRGDTILPEAGRAYINREDIRPGMIVPGDAVYNAFTERGWTWGGHWSVPQDFHHFERR